MRLAELANINTGLVTARKQARITDQEIINNYVGRILPICICVQQEDKYRLVDGYHRVCSNKDLNELLIVALK